MMIENTGRRDCYQELKIGINPVRCVIKSRLNEKGWDLILLFWHPGLNLFLEVYVKRKSSLLVVKKLEIIFKTKIISYKNYWVWNKILNLKLNGRLKLVVN